MSDASDFDFEFMLPDDDQAADEQRRQQDQQNQFYLFGKLMTSEEEHVLRKHVTGEVFCPPEIIERMAARYQRGELGELLPVVSPYLQGDEAIAAREFFATIEEQADENVFSMYRLAVSWASEIGFAVPHWARPIDERPMDEIKVEEPWDTMSSIAIH